MNDKLFGALIAICISLAGFSLKFAFDANAKIKSMESTNELRFEQIQKSLDEIANDKENDIRQDKTISKMWRALNWAKLGINTLEFEAGKAPTSWDLGDD